MKVETERRREIGHPGRYLARTEQIDAPHAAAYAARYKDFATRWQTALARWQQEAAPLRGVPVVVHHEAWVYLFDWLGIKQVATLEPKPGVPPSAGHLSEVLAQLRDQPAKMVIRAAYQDERPAEWLAEHAHIPVVVLPFTVGGTDGAKDLFGLYDDTIARLLKGAQ